MSARAAAELACTACVSWNNGFCALLQATTRVAKAFDSFYVLLSDEQKAQVDSGPRRWQWRR
jgi:hypothetical protein